MAEGAPGRHGRPLLGRELIRPLTRASGLVGLVLVVGVLGYRLIGGAQHSWLDAIYMTVITLTTVGYSEVIDLSASPAGRVFTTLLLVVGVGSFVYFFSNLTAFFVEGDIQRLLWRNRMDRLIRRLTGHTIVCGGGSTGQHVAAELLATRRPFVLIEADPQRASDMIASVAQEFPVVIGDATDDDILQEAGIEQAAGVVACISNDKDNLIVTVSARLLNPRLRIVCRCIEQKVEEKILKAGADAVVSPSRIGGLRMVSEMVRPTVVSFLDRMLRDREKHLRVEATAIPDGSPLAGQTMATLRARLPADALLVAIQTADGGWTHNPPESLELTPGMSVVYIGSPAARQAIEGLVTER